MTDINLNAIRRIHSRSSADIRYCDDCEDPYPCITYRLADALEAARAFAKSARRSGAEAVLDALRHSGPHWRELSLDQILGPEADHDDSQAREREEKS